MPTIALGLITITAGTQQSLTVNTTYPTNPLRVHSYLIEAWGATVGDAYIGHLGMNTSTGVGVIGRIPKSTATQYNYFTETCAVIHEAFDLSTLYLDGGSSGDKYLISAIEAYAT